MSFSAHFAKMLRFVCWCVRVGVSVGYVLVLQLREFLRTILQICGVLYVGLF